MFIYIYIYIYCCMSLLTCLSIFEILHFCPRISSTFIINLTITFKIRIKNRNQNNHVIMYILMLSVRQNIWGLMGSHSLFTNLATRKNPPQLAQAAHGMQVDLRHLWSQGASTQQHIPLQGHRQKRLHAATPRDEIHP